MAGGDVDAALAQELLHVAVAQGEAIVEPDAVAADLAGKAGVFVALGVGGRGHVWLPSGVFGWLLRDHHRSEDVPGQEAGSTT